MCPKIQMLNQGSPNVEIVGNILLGIGFIGAVICALWMLILQFQTSIFWGLACLFIPLVALLWLVMYWEDGKYPFLYSLGFLVLIFAGTFMAGDAAIFAPQTIVD